MLDLLEESKKLISIRSDEEVGTATIVKHLAPYCERLGFHVTLQSDGHQETNLIAHSVPRESSDLCPQGIFLGTHLDTVPGGNPALWTETGQDPFRPTLKGDRLFGRGSADTKLDFLCKLKAIENIRARYPNRQLSEIFSVPIALVGTYGEERALTGARLIRETNILHPKFALVGEPSELQPVIAHKGILYMRCSFASAALCVEQTDMEETIFRGRAAHGATPHLGENAIYKGMDWLFDRWQQNPNLELMEVHGGTVHNIVPEECRIKLRRGESASQRIRFLKRFFELHQEARNYLATHSDPAFEPAPTTTNVGVIRTYPDRIELEFDFRTIPGTDPDRLVANFKRLTEEMSESQVEVIRLNPPMATDRDSELARYVSQALTSVGLPVTFLTKAGNTEGSIYNAMGIQTIIFGPGLATGNIHAPNEFMYVSQLFKAVEFYEAFLKQFLP